eukprot:gene14098-18654_t
MPRTEARGQVTDCDLAGTERETLMNLDLSSEDLAFRDEIRTFLDAHLTPELRAAGRLVT